MFTVNNNIVIIGIVLLVELLGLLLVRLIRPAKDKL